MNPRGGSDDVPTERRRRADAPWWATSGWTLGPVALGFLILLLAQLGWTPAAILGGKAEGKNGETSSRVDRLVEFKRHVDATDSMQRTLEEIVRLQRQTCFNTARDTNERAGCTR